MYQSVSLFDYRHALTHGADAATLQALVKAYDDIRDGLGFRKTYRIVGPCLLGTNLDRTKYPPWGVRGGKDGEPGRFTLVKAGRLLPRRSKIKSPA